MAKLLRLTLTVALSVAAAHGQATQSAPEKAEAAKPVKTDAKKAEGAFRRALRLQAQPESTDNLTHALEALEESRALNPTEATYATSYEFVKQQLIASHLEKGDKLMQLGLMVEALAEFREVLRLEPDNAMAQERMRASVGGGSPRPAVNIVREFASEPEVRPKPGKSKFEFRGDSRQLLSSIGKQFGVMVLFDDTAPTRTVRFTLDDADFYTAMQAANRVAGTFWMPLSETQVIVAADNADSRRRLERMSVRTYELHNLQTAQELTDLVNLLRTMLDIRFVIADQAAQTITVRAPADTLRAVDSLVEDLSAARPEVMLEIHAFQLDRAMSRNIGVSLPLQFTLFNVASEARSLLSSGNNQALIDQLIATGGVSAADAAAIAAALTAQGSNSPFLKPFAVFGGGRTLTGLVIPNISLNLDYSQTTVSTIQHMTLRASQGSAATYRIGDRIPVLTSQYAPLLNIPGVTNNNATNGIIPSFNYEDLGITLKATPRVAGNNDVVLQLELQIKALSGQSFNSVPAISERSYTGSVMVKDGQASVLAGSINVQESKSVRGLPWFSRIPLLGVATSSHGKQEIQSELLFVITPHVLRAPRNTRDATETVLGQ
jgi:general secretion pathway protein D